MANINAVKLENKKIYLREEQETNWNIIYSYSKDRVSSLMEDINKRMPKILNQIEEQEKLAKNKEIKRSEMFVEDYKFISESETEICLLENDLGKQIRVKKEVQSVFNKPKVNVFEEEEEFVIKKVDNEKEIFDFISNSQKYSEITEEKNNQIKEEKTLPSNSESDFANLEGEPNFMHRNFFFNKKRRKIANCKVERAIEMNRRMNSEATLKMKHIKIKRNKIEIKKKRRTWNKLKESLFNGKKEVEKTEPKKIKKKKEIIELKKNRERIKKKKEIKIIKILKIKIDRNLKNICEEKKESALNATNELCEDSFEGLTIEAPNFVSSFDMIFGENQSSEDSTCLS